MNTYRKLQRLCPVCVCVCACVCVHKHKYLYMQVRARQADWKHIKTLLVIILRNKYKWFLFSLISFAVFSKIPNSTFKIRKEVSL
jgi:hypothetical protein